MNPRFSNAKWIFFDVGYTLLDETGSWDERFTHLASMLSERRGRPIAKAAIWTLYNDACERFEPKQWLTVCKGLAQDADECAELARLSSGWDHKLEKPHAGAGDVLRALAPRYRLGIIANQSLGTWERLCGHGWGELISVCVGSAEAGVMKPDPAIFQLALRKAGCEPSEAVMVGDRIDNDVAPARKLGMATIHVRQGGSGRQRPRAADETPDAVVDSIADVAARFV
ncbi:MAG: HAD family hydrolase [Tepidisphaeraceae bacterium]